MEIIFIDKILTEKSLKPPILSILEQNAGFAHILLYQPSGTIRLGNGPTHIGNEPTDEIKQKYYKFFELAFAKQVHLASTPEYSCPISTVKELVQNNIFPTIKNLWIIGAESLTKEGLNDFSNFCKENDVVLHFDQLVLQHPNVWVDPAIYLFQSQDETGKSIRVAIIQFKTVNMGVWTDDREREGIIPGNEVYVLRNHEASIYLLTLICSDSLNYNTIFSTLSNAHPTWTIHPYLFIHLQLNPKPHDPEFSFYRNFLFSQGNSFELICLNWAAKTGEYVNGKFDSWIKFSGSSYTLESTEIDFSEESFKHNYSLGCHLVNRKKNRYSYYFDSNEFVFYVKTLPVKQTGVSSSARKRSGPKVAETLIWNGQNWSITSLPIANHNFFQDFKPLLELINESASPLDTERLLELSTGSIKKGKSEIPWWSINGLSFLSQTTSETILRMTFSQDNSGEAVTHRTTQAQAFHDLQEMLIKTPNSFPEYFHKFRANNGKIRFPAVRDPNVKYSLNLCTQEGEEWMTVVNLGIKRIDEAKSTYKILKNLIGGQNGKRLLVWFKIASSFYYQTHFEEEPVKITDNIPRKPASEIESITR